MFLIRPKLIERIQYEQQLHQTTQEALHEVFKHVEAIDLNLIPKILDYVHNPCFNEFYNAWRFVEVKYREDLPDDICWIPRCNLQRRVSPTEEQRHYRFLRLENDTEDPPSLSVEELNTPAPPFDHDWMNEYLCFPSNFYMTTIEEFNEIQEMEEVDRLTHMIYHTQSMTRQLAYYKLLSILTHLNRLFLTEITGGLALRLKCIDYICCILVDHYFKETTPAQLVTLNTEWNRYDPMAIHSTDNFIIGIQFLRELCSLDRCIQYLKERCKLIF